MAKVAIVELRLPDKRLVFQRRDKNIERSPGRLTFFGGHIEDGEKPEEAIKRELKEETDLNIKDIKYLATFDLMAYDGPDKENTYYLYSMKIPSLEFKVYEGVGAEAFQKEAALKRDDLTNSARYSLENCF
jgi:8-oxo-dGTP pyrophosphatase MutT (NUDIX family)